MVESKQITLNKSMLWLFFQNRFPKFGFPHFLLLPWIFSRGKEGNQSNHATTTSYTQIKIEGWNLKITPLKRKLIFQTSKLNFHLTLGILGGINKKRTWSLPPHHYLSRHFCDCILQSTAIQGWVSICSLLFFSHVLFQQQTCNSMKSHLPPSKSKGFWEKKHQEIWTNQPPFSALRPSPQVAPNDPQSSTRHPSRPGVAPGIFLFFYQPRSPRNRVFFSMFFYC